MRGNQHMLDVLDVLHRDRLALRIHDGAFSAMDLTVRHPHRWSPGLTSFSGVRLRLVGFRSRRSMSTSPP
ncbi:hypothetical protein [Streptomyces sp. NPDC086787]|uniref:hypothetical protein n=1 Tax=Streptomyces sp. NPDC086787 TaxID=3365759 RepID=UPI0038278619